MNRFSINKFSLALSPFIVTLLVALVFFWLFFLASGGQQRINKMVRWGRLSRARAGDRATVIGGRGGAYLVVVEMVVLDVPRLGHHPVHPVGDAAGDSLGEGAAVEPASHDAVLGLRGVVAAVADVVADHGPAGADGGGHHERRDGVDASDGGEGVGQERGREEHREAAVVEHVGPREDLV